jgi:serine/threonine protein kinase
MRRRVLVVEQDSRRRVALRDALTACGLEIVESSSTTEAIGRMKSAAFSGLIVADDQRQLALKGLCTLAKKDHRDAHVFVLLKEGSDRHRVVGAAGDGATIIPQATSLEEIAARVIGKFGTHSPDVWRYAKTRVIQKSRLWEAHVARAPKTSLEVILSQLTEGFAKDEELREEFVGGATHAKEVMHDGFPRVREVGGLSDIPYVASELSTGISYGELSRRFIKGGPWLTANLAAWVAFELAAALEQAHAHGLVHGAISPDTIWLTTSGRVQLLHLGIAGFLGVLERSMGASLGMSTPAAYLAPEQVKQTGVDVRTDVFLVGVVLHELLARHPLFLRPNASETRNAIANGAVPRPNAGAPDAIVDVAMACLERNPAFRPKGARDLRAELGTALTGVREPPKEQLASLVRIALT